jgi:hypothetical protein
MRIHLRSSSLFRGGPRQIRRPKKIDVAGAMLKVLERHPDRKLSQNMLFGMLPRKVKAIGNTQLLRVLTELVSNGQVGQEQGYYNYIHVSAALALAGRLVCIIEEEPVDPDLALREEIRELNERGALVPVGQLSSELS